MSMFALGFSSCSLDEDTSSQTSPENFFRNTSECKATLNSCYIPLKTIYTYDYLIAVEGVTDILFIASGTQDAQLDISPSKPRVGAKVWTQAYLGVQRANFAINGISKSEHIEDREKDVLVGEAIVIRAYYYYLLTSFFGDVPYYEEDVANQAILDKISVLPRMSADETRDKLIAQLQEYAPKMEQVRTSDTEENRLGAAVAWMLIGKMAMWNEEWEVALDAISELEAIYGDFSQYDLETNIMFRNKNTPESIMEIQHTYTPGSLNYSSTATCICMPYPRRAGTDIYAGVNVPELGSASTAWSPLRPNYHLSGYLQPEEGDDKRTKYNLAWEYNGHRFDGVGTRPWMGPKFWCPSLQGTYDGNNYKIFRYADVILMKSECYAMLEKAEESVRYLNMIKERAGIALYSFRTYPRLIEEMRNERARELVGEFQRKFDLVRWGIWYQVTFDFNDYSKVVDAIKPCHEYYPIPDTEVIYSGNNLDNDAYNAYGL